MTASLDRLEQLSKIDMSGLTGKVIDQLPDPLVVVDGEGRIVIFNREAELFFGWPREVVIGEPVEKLVVIEAQDRHVAHREGYAAAPRVRAMGAHDMKLTGLHRTGRELPGLEINLSPLVTNSGIYTAAVIRRPLR